jgi:phosphoesterase RecJ-like protein
MVDYARSIEGVEIGVLIEERPEGVVKASLRAKDAAYRMDRIAAAFQGGGHACAAGLSIKMDINEFYTRLLGLLREQIRVVASATKET